MSKSKSSVYDVEVEVAQGLDPVGPVAAVPLAEPGARHRVLEGRQDAVADVLVQRHAALEGPAADHHPRAEHRVGAAVEDRGDDVLDDLGGVLPVAVEQDHDVEAVAHRPGVAGLLVAAVAEVLLVAHDRQREVLVGPVGEADRVRVVLARVVGEEDVVDGGAERPAGAGRGCCTRVVAALYATTRTPTRGDEMTSAGSTLMVRSSRRRCRPAYGGSRNDGV